jgi:hypothetical protein
MTARFKDHPGSFWEDMPPDQREALFDAAQKHAEIAATVTVIPNVDGNAARKLVAVLTEAGEPLDRKEIERRMEYESRLEPTGAPIAGVSIEIKVPEGFRPIIYDDDKLSIFLNAMQAAGMIVQTATGRWKLP